MPRPRTETNDGRLGTPKGALMRWKMTKENAPELYERMLKALDEQTEPKGNGKDFLKLSLGEHGYTVTIGIPGEVRVRFGEGTVVTIYKDNSAEIEMYDMWGRDYHVLIREKEELLTETFYFDNFDNCIELHRRDRTTANRLADNKGQALGTFLAMLVNELDHLKNGETLSVSITTYDKIL